MRPGGLGLQSHVMRHCQELQACCALLRKGNWLSIDDAQMQAAHKRWRSASHFSAMEHCCLCLYGGMAWRSGLRLIIEALGGTVRCCLQHR